MGAWGTAIFADDLALDIRGAWRDGVLGGEHADDLSGALIAEHGLDVTADIDAELLDSEEPTGWFALALAQHETGRLQPLVADRALALIDAGGDCERFESDAIQRRKVLERLAGKLRGPQPAPKRLRPYRAPDQGIAAGDVIRVYAADRRRSGLLLVTGISAKGFIALRGLTWTEASPLPGPAALAQLPYLSQVDRGLMSGHVSEADADIATPFDVTIYPRRGKRAFGPHIGDVVANNIAIERPAEDTGSYADWQYVVDTISSTAWDLNLQATRQRLERYGPGWAGIDFEYERRIRANEEWLDAPERVSLLAMSEDLDQA